MNLNAARCARAILYSEMAQLAQQARERATVVRCCIDHPAGAEMAGDILAAKATILEAFVGDLMHEMMCDNGAFTTEES